MIFAIFAIFVMKKKTAKAYRRRPFIIFNQQLFHDIICKAFVLLQLVFLKWCCLRTTNRKNCRYMEIYEISLDYFCEKYYQVSHSRTIWNMLDTFYLRQNLEHTALTHDLSGCSQTMEDSCLGDLMCWVQSASLEELHAFCKYVSELTAHIHKQNK